MRQSFPTGAVPSMLSEDAEPVDGRKTFLGRSGSNAATDDHEYLRKASEELARRIDALDSRMRA